MCSYHQGFSSSTINAATKSHAHIVYKNVFSKMNIIDIDFHWNTTVLASVAAYKEKRKRKKGHCNSYNAWKLICILVLSSCTLHQHFCSNDCAHSHLFHSSKWRHVSRTFDTLQLPKMTWLMTSSSKNCEIYAA